ncbi:hypothetical protein ACS3QZ_19635 (plasmid) [Shimia sp. W99]
MFSNFFPDWNAASLIAGEEIRFPKFNLGLRQVFCRWFVWFSLDRRSFKFSGHAAVHDISDLALSNRVNARCIFAQGFDFVAASYDAQDIRVGDLKEMRCGSAVIQALKKITCSSSNTPHRIVSIFWTCEFNPG